MSSIKSSSSANNHPAVALQKSSGAIPSRVITMIEKGRYSDALKTLQTLPPAPLVTHVMGVCAIRAGSIPLAVRIFRGLCLNPGTTVLRWESDDVMRINFATALLLDGLPSGAVDILGELHQRDCPAAVVLRQAIGNWVSQLSFWQRWNWRLNHIEPAEPRVRIDFTPGVMPIPLPTDLAKDTDPGRPTDTPQTLAA